ncbi:MAG: ABC transporter permease subunit [Acidobacteria bacterium]|nr:ABC transporter permease subunit [Acidobacteriota bacterium]
MRNLIAIARLELRAAARLKWIQVLAAAFALMTAAAAYAAGAATELYGADGFARTTMTLVPVVLVLVPLGAIVLGVSSQAIETGSDPFLFVQPVGRATILFGRWLGELAALGGAIALGFGAGGAIIASSSGPDGLTAFAAFVALSVALAAIFLSLAAAVAATAGTRTTALGAATFVWFFFVLLYDGLALSLAGQLTGSTGGRLLFGSVFGNPTDVIRIAMLQVAGTSNVLGAAGEAWTRFLGGERQAAAAAATALAAWTAVPLGIAAAALKRRDV